VYDAMKLEIEHHQRSQSGSVLSSSSSSSSTFDPLGTNNMNAEMTSAAASTSTSHKRQLELSNSGGVTQSGNSGENNGDISSSLKKQRPT
jgi:hypothetical protein